MEHIKLAVLDMSGTTVNDHQELETCLYHAGLKTGLRPERPMIRKYLGLPHLEVVRKLWAERMDAKDADFEATVAGTYHLFQAILQNHYVLKGAEPMDGAVDTFKWLRAEGIYIALASCASRKIVKIILDKLGWSEGLDEEFRGSEISLIDLSLTPSEAGGKGNPHPDMVQQAMAKLQVEAPDSVIRIGDTAYSLESGKQAGCRLSIGVLGGTGEAKDLSGADLVLDRIDDLRDAVTAELQTA